LARTTHQAVLCRQILLRSVTDGQSYDRLSLSDIYDRSKNMSLSSHLMELKKKHQNLAESVEEMQRSPAMNDLEIAKLKKQKLLIKEEIARLSTH
jgi:hypothetical protein